ncbi:23S rRNA (adenine(1618)-N(6))-methyltransferase RlmF [Vibrio cholerae]|uniref:23S rRNA (adenine(1618)-N(6))-methyltransferase RlmF n=1 Tax=Vibrio cholerae TaxID=666 RepID=UPI000E6CD2D4|nr:23S rRNA (adenine(1618)-N(6))-methyltransferase RlmF [Vibrio cholerae]EGQ8670260.1 23S rRNA (adenine(1618)-N(6))-methyltransferase RlmF [Vibrio cholerae]EGQ9460606.1 23S rRNA (adenine(1618)-N(6))-methyltransferase RlmF [Vibrio cholerae]EGR1327040.1 23S rRNA (adenine(1618)-N(6))-methyltransferase RlmF [Vibrio cholerae]EGR1444855.1 23S rRNA (adenine(1618)-N(6))-methyltransferase RlmF [Vibrio cholerae]EGR2317340.1 23S rRNA (adenine(1618)-N(6))-methyltransferase RlmF [Vibrio cholerae]
MNTPLKPKHGQKTNQKPKANKPVVKKQQTKQPPTHKVQGEEVAAVKSGLHPRNRHRGQYDFPALIKVVPELQSHVMKNPKGQWTINFADPIAVKLLNKALLALHYGVTYWDIPEGFLCPPIPGRADYIHRVADLLLKDNPKLNPSQVTALDIGVGANCIYPIVGVTEYGWSWVGSDVDPVSIQQASLIVQSNSKLQGHIECRLQNNSQHIFQGIIGAGERYTLTTCNPPFHASLADAQQGTQRKLTNLQANQRKKGRLATPTLSQSRLNFGGQKAELWCPGGEAAFIGKMAVESQQFAEQVLWFTTLISKGDNVRGMKKQLEKLGAQSIQVVEMAQGQKISRFVAWSFQNAEQRKLWWQAKC